METEAVADKLKRWDKDGVSKPFLKPTEYTPEIEQLEEWGFDGVVEATDGCRVEPDGYCEHGHVSWMVYMEVI